ncbi:MAG: Uma2 family endonuclease [Eubacteriales bacterium]|nr:Uma2 family endonuclease [Eubacteriales bacterium]
MSEDITEYGYNQKERMYPDFIKEAQAAYKESGDPVLGRFLSKKQGEYRVEDYYALPETCRVELIDGVIYNMAAPTNLHQAIITEIAVQLDTWMRRKKGKCMVMISPADVQLDQDDKTMVQPDIYVVCDRNKMREKVLFGAPDFIVEILSPSGEKSDRIIKYNKYRKAGVREYWIVDPKKLRVAVYDTEHKAEPAIYTFEDKIPVHIFNGELKIDFEDIYRKIKFVSDR